MRIFNWLQDSNLFVLLVIIVIVIASIDYLIPVKNKCYSGEISSIHYGPVQITHDSDLYTVERNHLFNSVRSEKLNNINIGDTITICLYISPFTSIGRGVRITKIYRHSE